MDGPCDRVLKNSLPNLVKQKASSARSNSTTVNPQISSIKSTCPTVKRADKERLSSTWSPLHQSVLHHVPLSRRLLTAILLVTFSMSRPSITLVKGRTPPHSPQSPHVTPHLLTPQSPFPYPSSSLPRRLVPKGQYQMNPPGKQAHWLARASRVCRPGALKA